MQVVKEVTKPVVYNLTYQIKCPRCGCPEHMSLEQEALGKQWKECTYCGITFDKKELN